MKYTKYNYKRRRNNGVWKFIASLLVGIIASCMIGLGVAWIVWKVLPINDSAQVGAEITDGIEVSTEGNGQQHEGETIVSEGQNTSEYYFLQCGYFSKKDNADQTYAKIASEGRAFIAEESDKYRVLTGIYTSENVDSAIQELGLKGVESVKITFSLNENDPIEAQVSAICDGYLKILTTTFDDGVDHVNTEEFKSWIDTLDNISSGENIEVLQSLKDYIKGLPVELSKEYVSSEIDYLYEVLLSFK